jgi:hypothetical protein
MSHCSFKKSFLLSTAFLATALVSCKKDEQKASAPQAAPTKVEEALGKLASPAEMAAATSNPLYTTLPKEVAAFFSLNLQSPAFDRLLSSKWGKSYLAKTSTLTTQMPDLAAIMAEAGMDMTKPEELKKQLSEALVFLAGPETGQMGHGGLMLKSSNEAKTQSLFAALSASAQKRGGGAPSAPGEFNIVMTVPQSAIPAEGPQQIKKVNMTGKLAGDKIIISDNADLLNKLAAGTEKFVAPEVTTALSTAGANSIGIGFIDFKKLRVGSKDEGEALPVKSGVISAEMSDHPTVQVKLLKEKISPVPPTAATAKVLLSSIPNDPLLYTVIEAGAIRELAMESSPKAQEAMNDTQMAFLKSVGQIGLGAKVAADAQAMMPIPEIIISVQTSDAKGLMDTMVNSASGAVKGYGLPGATSEKQLGGKTVKVVQGAMGVNLYAADLGGVVVASTTEALLAGAIERSSGKGIASNLSATNTEALTKPGVAKLYLSFPELAKLLKSAQSMAGMAGGAPGQENAMSAALSDENLKSLEDLGSLMGSMSSDNESYNVNISYN